jgi:hypothetical protein
MATKHIPDIRMIGDRKMQCKDIPDDLFFGAILVTPGVGGSLEPTNWRMRWDVRETLEEAIGPIPEKLFLAKAAKLIKAKKIGGCECGCRGDYHMPCQYESCCK